MYHRKCKQLREVRFSKYTRLRQVLVFISNNSIFCICGEYYMREVITILLSQLISQGPRHRPPRIHVAIVCQVLQHTSYTVILIEVLLVRKLIFDPESYNNSNRHAYRKTCNIDGSMKLVLLHGAQ